MAVDLQIAVSESELPGWFTDLEGKVGSWVATSFSFADHNPMDITIRIVDVAEMTQLNRDFRGKDKPTNVLSFPFESVEEVDYAYLGDIIICLSVVKDESNQQFKSFQKHFALMVVHGTLHLCGFDHQNDKEANEMEFIERNVLAEFELI